MVQATSGIVPIERRRFVRSDVDRQGRPVEEFYGPLVKRLRGDVLTDGHDLNEACVRFEVAEGEKPFTEGLIAWWMPPSDALCELLGGPHDGEAVRVREAAGGLPELTLRMPTPSRSPRPSFEDEQFVHPPSALAEPLVYRLVGFRNDSARWVYQV